MIGFVRAKALPLVLGLTLLAMGQARAADVPVFSTGVDANGVPLANGAADPHWTVSLDTTGTPNTPAGQAEVRTSAEGFPIPPWFNPTAIGANWISPSPFALSVGNGEIDYSQTFSLTSPSLTQITLRLTSDDMISGVLVNGHSLGITTPDQSYATLFGPFSIPTADLVNGNNTLVVQTQNTHDATTGVLVSVAATVVPEPGSIALLGLGLGGLFTFRRFVRRPVSRP